MHWSVYRCLYVTSYKLQNIHTHFLFYAYGNMYMVHMYHLYLVPM